MRSDFDGRHTASCLVTTPGDQGYDCISRYFAPAKGIDEDPVTGGAHCALAPFWTARLGKPEIRARHRAGRAHSSNRSGDDEAA